MDWKEKKQLLIQQQQELSPDKKLKRTRIVRGRSVVDYDPWYVSFYFNRPTLQRIATHMDRPVSPTNIERKLLRGEKVTTHWGSVYSLVPANGHH